MTGKFLKWEKFKLHHLEVTGGVGLETDAKKQRVMELRALDQGRM